LSKLDINILFSKFTIKYLFLKKEIKLRDNILFNINLKEKEDRFLILNIYFCLQYFNKLLSKLNTNILQLKFVIRRLLLRERVKIRNNILVYINFKERENKLSIVNIYFCLERFS
jgi:hypothetical protein